MRIEFILAAVVALGFLIQSAQAAWIVKDGEPLAAIVLPEQPITPETTAANELRSHIQLISGAELPIITAGEKTDLLPILIGRAAPESARAELAAKSKDYSAYILHVTDKQVILTGLINEDDSNEAAKLAAMTPIEKRDYYRSGRALGAPRSIGIQIAAYELLEQLGVRWFIPGEIGRVVPEMKSIEVKNQKLIDVPSAKGRNLQAIYADTWGRRMRHGGDPIPSSHGLPGMGSHGKGNTLFDEHPEYFSLINGVRAARQHCLSNPEVVKRVSDATREYFRNHPYDDIIGMGANDGRGFCECENCKALDGGDYDAFGGYESMSDRYIWFFNQVLEGISDEFPDKRIGFYAYSVYNRPPVKQKPSPRIVPAVALITLCRMHGNNNPICPEKQYEQWIIQEWGKIVPEVYYRGYWFNLADPGLPYFQISRIAAEIPLGKKLNVAVWRVESPYNWAGEAPSRYIASKLMWNPEADVDALMKDFGEKFFGPAAEPMLQYITLMDTARRDADHHTGSSWNVPQIYDEEVCSRARDCFIRARKLAPKDSVFAERVRLYETAFMYLEAFNDMMNRRGKNDHVGAMKALERIDLLREELSGYGRERFNDPNPPMISRKAEEYMQRFFRSTTEDGYAKVTNGNTMVVGLSDEWLTQLDPDQIGVDIGWHKPQNTGSNWQPMLATGATWSDQGLRYYRSDLWHRQTVDIPANVKGKRVFFWIGAIDEEATVWINGQNIGTFRGTFKPFDLDATDAIKPGEPNVVVVRVRNERLNELGTGGIMGPAMFYIPGDPNAKPTGQGPAKDADTTLETIAE